MPLTMPAYPDLDIEPLTEAERLRADRRSAGRCITCARRPRVYAMDPRGRCRRCVRRFTQKRRQRQTHERYRRLLFVAAPGASLAGVVHRLISAGPPRRLELFFDRVFALASTAGREATYIEVKLTRRVEEAIMEQDRSEWGEGGR